jgi:hypothetical protein
VDESRDSRGDRTLAGQIKNTDSETVGDWKNDVLLQEIIEYDPCGIYSSDETSLCFSIQPAKSLTFLETCVVVNIPSNFLTAAQTCEQKIFSRPDDCAAL